MANHRGPNTSTQPDFEPGGPASDTAPWAALDRATPMTMLVGYGVRVHDAGRGVGAPSLIITRRWFSPLCGPAAIVSVLLFGILISARRSVLADAADPKVAIVLVAWVLLAVGAAHTCLSSLVNRTTLGVGGGLLSMRRGPFPPRRTLRIDVGEIASVSYRARTLTSGAWFSAEDGHAMTAQAVRRYDLGVDCKDGRHIVLLRGFASDEPLSYLKWLIEAHLGLRR
jgi:hypothetical protein